MKIIYLHQYFNTPDMSGGTRSFEMARRFVAQGHEVHMITSWRQLSESKSWFESNVEGIHVHWLPVPYSNHMSYLDRIKSFFKFAIMSASRSAQINADVVFATSTPLTIALPAVYASKIKKIPMVFEVRDLWPELPIAMGALNNPITKFLAKRLELFAYKHSSSIVALSPGMKNGVVRTGYPSERIAVIPNSSDIDMFCSPKSLGDEFRSKRLWLGSNPLLIYTGTFGLINGVSYMVDLAIELAKLNSNVRILLIGDGAEFDVVKHRASSSNVLHRNLFIEKSLPKREIPAALSAATMACSLFVDKPEMRPNSANKFFDALAAGKPILINYGGWMHDLVKSRDCGLALWQMPLSEVASVLDSKMNDTTWLDNSGHASLKLARKYFDRDLLAGDLCSVLQNVVDGNLTDAEKIAPGEYV